MFKQNCDNCSGDEQPFPDTQVGYGFSFRFAAFFRQT